MHYWWVESAKAAFDKLPTGMSIHQKLQLWNGLRRVQENERSEAIFKPGHCVGLSVISHTLSSGLWQLLQDTVSVGAGRQPAWEWEVFWDQPHCGCVLQWLHTEPKHCLPRFQNRWPFPQPHLKLNPPPPSLNIPPNLYNQIKHSLCFASIAFCTAHDILIFNLDY